MNFSGFECGRRLNYGIFRFQTQQDDIPFLPVLSGKAAANVNISPRRGEWGNRVSPFPHPREGLGGLRPPRNNLMFIAALCGGAAWTADVKMGEPGSPIPPPPGGFGRAQPLRRGMGKRGFSIPPPHCQRPRLIARRMSARCNAPISAGAGKGPGRPR